MGPDDGPGVGVMLVTTFHEHGSLVPRASKLTCASMLSPISEPDPFASAITTGGFAVRSMKMVMTRALIASHASGWGIERDCTMNLLGKPIVGKGL
jgi:hypothetical protein